MNEKASKILIVDDNVDVANTIRDYYLEYDHGIIPLASSDPKAVLSIIDENPDIRLILSDFYMPAMSGLDLLITVREKYPEILFVMMSGYHTPELKSDAINRGAVKYFKKPFNIKDLTSLLQETLSEAETGFDGTLEAVELPDIVQLMGTSERTVELRLKSDKGKGKIYFVKGQLVHAECKNLVGDEAFYKMFGWKGGSFQMLPHDGEVETTVTSSWQGLILEAARLQDEAIAFPRSKLNPEPEKEPIDTVGLVEGYESRISTMEKEAKDNRAPDYLDSEDTHIEPSSIFDKLDHQKEDRQEDIPKLKDEVYRSFQHSSLSEEIDREGNVDPVLKEEMYRSFIDEQIEHPKEQIPDEEEQPPLYSKSDSWDNQEFVQQSEPESEPAVEDKELELSNEETDFMQAFNETVASLQAAKPEAVDEPVDDFPEHELEDNFEPVEEKAEIAEESYKPESQEEYPEFESEQVLVLDEEMMGETLVRVVNYYMRHWPEGAEVLSSKELPLKKLARQLQNHIRFRMDFQLSRVVRTENVPFDFTEPEVTEAIQNLLKVLYRTWKFTRSEFEDQINFAVSFDMARSISPARALAEFVFEELPDNTEDVKTIIKSMVEYNLLAGEYSDLLLLVDLLKNPRIDSLILETTIFDFLKSRPRERIVDDIEESMIRLLDISGIGTEEKPDKVQMSILVNMMEMHGFRNAYELLQDRISSDGEGMSPFEFRKMTASL